MLSATISDQGISIIQNVANFSLSVFKHDRRPVALQFLDQELSYQEIVEKFESVIVFAFSYKGVNQIAQTMRNYNAHTPDKEEILSQVEKFNVNNQYLLDLLLDGIAIYHGGLLIKEKLLVEALFRQKLVKILVGTNGLSLGINLPAQAVVFAQLEMYYSGLISSSEFQQMAGRAGRPGLHNVGFVGISDFGVESYNSVLSDNYDYLKDAPISESLTGMKFNIERLLKNAVIHEEKIKIPERIVDKELDFFVTVFSGGNRDEMRINFENFVATVNAVAENSEINSRLLLDSLQKYYFNEFDFNRNIEIIINIINGYEDLLIDIFGVNLEEFEDYVLDGRFMKNLMQIRKFIRSKLQNYQVVRQIDNFVREVDKNYISPRR